MHGAFVAKKSLIVVVRSFCVDIGVVVESTVLARRPGLPYFNAVIFHLKTVDQAALIAQVATQGVVLLIALLLALYLLTIGLLGV